MDARPTVPPIIGVSPKLRTLIDLARRIATTPAPVLLVGETGTGKEVFAQNIHVWSRRRGPMVDLNVGAFPEGLIEGLLFGARRGSYTGAVDRRGLVSVAHRGTLFLDELHQLSLEGQVKLLRVLETGEVRPLGAEHSHRVRFRLIAAVQDDIEDRMLAGLFRHDLFQRIAGFVLHLPALAERPEDLMPLAQYFAEQEKKTLHPECESVLRLRRWPGNIRELKFAVQRAAALAEHGEITPVILAKSLAIVPPMAFLERRIPSDLDLLEACDQSRWHAQRAATALGISRITLWRRLAALGLSVRAVRRQSRIVSPVRTDIRNFPTQEATTMRS